MSVSVILQEKPVLLEDQKSAVRKFIAVLKRLDFLTPLFFKAIPQMIAAQMLASIPSYFTNFFGRGSALVSSIGTV